MSKKRSQDVVQLCSSTICFRIHNDILQKGTKDFEILELGQRPKPVGSAQADVFVNFDAGISREDALASLRRVEGEIEKNGLPGTSQYVARKYAAWAMQMERLDRKLSAELEKLPEDLRDQLLERLERPAPRKYLRLVIDNDVPQDAGDGGNDDE